MKVSNWLIINRRGVVGTRKTKPALQWDEIAIKLNLEVPDQLFQRPTIEASVKVNELPNNAYDPELIINSIKEIENQTGAKINLTVSHVAEESEDKNEPA